MEKNWHPRAMTSNLRTVVVYNELIDDINSHYPMSIIVYYLWSLQLFPMLITPNQFDVFPVKLVDYLWLPSVYF